LKQITFHLDFISPYAYLAFEELPQALEGLSYSVSYRPVLFAAMLKQNGQLGPAEIPTKRDWTYRQVLWLAQKKGIGMQMPSAHPFNPLPLLRLATTCASADGTVNRYVCETILRHVWSGGTDAADAQRLDELTQLLQPQIRVTSDEAKVVLKNNTDAALASGVFGVPSYVVDDKVFWGLDALPMLRDYLENGAWFAAGEWDGVRKVSVGVSRKS
jgi:2-hydroxychromene-2-carboxylate isomerase